MTITVKLPPVLENVTFVMTGLLVGMVIVVGAGAGSVVPAALNAVVMVIVPAVVPVASIAVVDGACEPAGTVNVRLCVPPLAVRSCTV